MNNTSVKRKYICNGLKFHRSVVFEYTLKIVYNFVNH